MTTTLLTIAIGVFVTLLLTTINKRSKHTIDSAINQALPNDQPDDQCAGPFDPEIEDLVDEINRLRAENAILSGAYQFMYLETDGRRYPMRICLN